MDKYNLLDCTLRDGGYITNWEFNDEIIKSMITRLIDSDIDFIECGYLNNKAYSPNSTLFKNIEQIGYFIPKYRKNSIILAMADVLQFKPEEITPYSGKSIDGIRVVFYKHQIEEAIALCKSVINNGYKLFVQPMVTIDYTIDEFTALVRRIAKLKPYSVAIVDSFGYMIKQDFRQYFKILDNVLNNDAIVGFHSHNNMQLAFITAQDILDYETTRKIIIDASLLGMGRGAGNLNTELIANYYNMVLGQKYNVIKILELISDYIMPISEYKQWGYSPYLYLTGLYHCHPNYACYLLENHQITVSEFEKYIKFIPDEMRTKCRRPYVDKIYQDFKKKYGSL